MRHLFNRRQGDGAEHDLSGAAADPLEGELRSRATDEGAARLPFADEFPPVAAAIPEGDTADAALDQVLARAADLDRLGRRLDAILVLRSAVADGAPDPRLFQALANLMEAAGDAEEALGALDEGLRVTSGEPALRVARGALLGRLNRYAESEEELRLALTTMPGAVEANLHFGLSLLRRGRHAEAIEVLERAAGQSPDHPEVAFHLAEARYHAGDLEGALDGLQRAAILAPRDPRAYKLLGRLLDRLGRTEEAMSMHRKAREAGAG